MFRKALSIILIFLLLFIGFPLPPSSYAQDNDEYTIAVLDLDANGISESEARSLSNSLSLQVSRVISSEKYKDTSNIIYTVVERSQMDKVFDQFEIQNTGCTDLSCAVEFGKMLSVERIIIGSVGLVGETFTLNTSIVDVETAQIINVAGYKLRGQIDELLDVGIPEVVNELLGVKKSRKKFYIIAVAAVAVVTAAAILLQPTPDKDDSATISIDIPVP